MTNINTAKNLIKRRHLVSDLAFNLSSQKQEKAEQLIAVCQDSLKAIKQKIKEKSKVTKRFKCKLEDAERDELKSTVCKISIEIKYLESVLKENELKLCEILTESEVERLPIQFTKNKIDKNTNGEPTFSILKSHNDWIAQWSQFLFEIEAHSTYHRYEWLQALSEYSNFEIFLFVLKVDNKIVAGVPMLFMKSLLFGKCMVSVPYVNYGGMLAHSNELTMILLEHIKEWATEEKIDFFEFRTTTSGLKLPVKSEKCSMILPLPPTNELLEEQLNAKVRAQYKKADTYKPEVFFGGLELLDDFYKVFSQNMRDLGTPVYGKSLFKKILQEKETNAFLCVVKIYNKPTSVAFLTGYRDLLEIPWASTLRSANKYDANMWMYRMILQKAIDLGYEYFDFGRSTKHASTYKFKKQWGAQPIEHHWYYLLRSNEMPQTNPNNPKYRLLIAMWKRLPVWVANIIGPHVVKNIP